MWWRLLRCTYVELFALSSVIQNIWWYLYIFVFEENLVIFMVMMNFRYYRSCFIYINLLLSVTQQAIISDFANFVPALLYKRWDFFLFLILLYCLIFLCFNISWSAYWQILYIFNFMSEYIMYKKKMRKCFLLILVPAGVNVFV